MSRVSEGPQAEDTGERQLQTGWREGGLLREASGPSKARAQGVERTTEAEKPAVTALLLLPSSFSLIDSLFAPMCHFANPELETKQTMNFSPFEIPTTPWAQAFFQEGKASTCFSHCPKHTGVTGCLYCKRQPGNFVESKDDSTPHSACLDISGNDSHTRKRPCLFPVAHSWSNPSVGKFQTWCSVPL